MVSTFDNNIGGALMLRDYWNQRYEKGGGSGHGSVGNERAWKWRIVRQYVRIEDCSVLDIGCGDMSFWGDIQPKAYIGIDYSLVVIERNKITYPDLLFYCEDLVEPRVNICPVDVIFCFDVLFHQPRESDFTAILCYLDSVNATTLFLTNLRVAPQRLGGYMSYRVLGKYLDLLSKWTVEQVYVSPIDQKRLYVLKRLRFEE